MTLGSEVRRLRLLKGLTLRQVEDATGISQSQLRNIEGDRKEPSYRKVAALADLLGPEVLAAAYSPAHSEDSTTARYRSRADWGMARQASALVLTAWG